MSNNIWFYSDPHFGHANIIKFCKRPFANVQEMDEALIENHNKVVKPGDRVFCLGDFSFDPPEKYFKRLNGQQHLIMGNHDNYDEHRKLGWTWIKDNFDLRHNGKTIVLHHFAKRVWNNMHKGAYHGFGHTHNTLPPYGWSCDFGVDTWGYSPVSFDQVIAFLNTQPFISGIPERDKQNGPQGL